MEDTVASFGGILDFFNFLAPDWSKVKKENVKAHVGLLIDDMKDATTWPGNFDDMMWDQLKSVVNTYIDKIAVKDGPLVVGDADIAYSAGDVDTYLNTFSGVNDEVREKLRKRPRTLNRLKKDFTAQEQAKLVGNPFLIGLLTIFGPLVIDLIKRWLSK